MMNVFFKRGNGEYEFVKAVANEAEGWNAVRDDIKRRNPNYTVHYVRQWESDGDIWYDVGSWSEFYVLRGKDND